MILSAQGDALKCFQEIKNFVNHAQSMYCFSMLIVFLRNYLAFYALENDSHWKGYTEKWTCTIVGI